MDTNELISRLKPDLVMKLSDMKNLGYRIAKAKIAIDGFYTFTKTETREKVLVVA